MIDAISGGTTLLTSEVVMSNQGGVSWGMDSGSQSITAQVGVQSFWCNNRYDPSANEPQGPYAPFDIYLQIASFPLNMNATRAQVIASASANKTNSNAQTACLMLGVYTMSGSTASLATLWSSSGGMEGLTNGGEAGVSWKSLTGEMAITPGSYLFGLAFTAQANTNGASVVFANLCGDHIGTIVSPISGDDHRSYFGDGYHRTQFTGGMPSSIHMSDVVKAWNSNSSYSYGTPSTTSPSGGNGGQPWLQLVGT